MITHVITEDSGSGNKFWAEVFGYLLGDSCRIHTSCGITNIGKKFGELLQSGIILKNDTIIFVVDRAADTQLVAQMELINSEAGQYGLSTIYYVWPYCFEEIFLSFTKLLDWVRPNIDDSCLELYSTVCDDINKCRNYMNNRLDDFDSFSENFEVFCKRQSLDSSRVGRESFAANLLRYITSRQTGFTISKKEIGSCWVYDCCETSKRVIQNSLHQGIIFNRKCGISDYALAKDKLYEVIRRSFIPVRCPDGSKTELKHLVSPLLG